MKAAELLDMAKERLGISSDYGLAKAAKVNKGWMPAIRRGERAVPLHLAYWLAITLEADPAKIVAELAAEREKNKERAEFWRSFLSRAASIGILCCTLVSMPFATSGNAQAANGGGNRGSHNLRFRPKAHFA